MTREIKFRAWDGDKMIYSPWPFFDSSSEVEGYVIGLDGTVYRFCNTEFYPSIKKIGFGELYSEDEPKQFNLMQYTGLKDKNGKEVYEGDVVKECAWIDWRTNNSRDWRKGRPIIWDNNNAKFVLLNEDGTPNCFNINTECGYEVIGNIYENPELITNLSKQE